MNHNPHSITVPALLIRINQLFSVSMSAEALYEATRGIWKLGERRKNARYAFAVYQGVIREVYVIERWHPAGTTTYTTRPTDGFRESGRWEFTGRLAEREIRDRYVGESVASYFKQGNANPIQYVNC